MRIAVIGPSGSGKTWLSAQLAASLGIDHVEIDALFRAFLDHMVRTSRPA